MPDPAFEMLPDTKLLRLSQPTVSIWLSRLRERLGDPLFVRTSVGMCPTPRARDLIDTVRTTLDALREIGGTAPAFDPARSDRRFRIAMSDASHVDLLPRLLGHLRHAARACSMQAVPIDESLAERLQSGAADHPRTGAALDRPPSLRPTP